MTEKKTPANTAFSKRVGEITTHIDEMVEALDAASERQNLVMFQVRLPQKVRQIAKVNAAAQGVSIQDYIARLIIEDMPKD